MQIINLKGGLQAMVDDEDFEELSLHNWKAEWHGRSFRAYRSTGKGGKWAKFYMHRVILKCQNGQSIDHIDANPLNNQKSNLRICTHQQNCFNSSSRKNSSSKFLGVHWAKHCRKWISQFEINGKNNYIGSYDNETEAALAYNVAASFAFKEFARLNVV